MIRRRLFAAVGAAALVLASLAVGGVAIAVVQGQSPPSDSGPTSSAPRTPEPTASGVGGLSLAERLRPWAPGDHLVTEKELRAFHAASAASSVGGEQYETVLKTDLYAVDCMRNLGYFWDPRTDPRQHPDFDRSNVDPEAWAALYGEDPTNPDWTMGGCDQYAAHVTGLDGGPGEPKTAIPGYTPPHGG